MINVAEITKRGAENKELPPWANMRHAWMANDGLRDKDLEYPENVVQIKNLDYKKKLDAERFAAILDSWKMDKQRELLYASSGDASDIDSDSYVSNSLFDLCVPASYMGDSDKAYPVIVSVHGGGWFYGDKELYSHYCCHLAQSGFVVVNFNYRLSPQNKYPSAIEDVAYLVKYIDDHARVFDLDMNRFFMLGDSAGAQLTAQYCIAASNQEYRKKLDYFTYDKRPARICLNCGAYDMGKRDDTILDWYLRKENSLVVSKEQYQLFMEQLAYMNVDFPETYLMYSENDDLRFHTIELDKKMNDIGVAHVMRAFGAGHPESGHVFHLNLRNPDGIQCNVEECSFFKNK